MNQADSPLTGALDVLKRSADEALTREPYSVVDKNTLAPSGDRQDYWHPAPYWWPNPNSPDGLPYIRRDGERVPGTQLYEAESEKYDRTRLQRVFDDSFALALVWAYTKERRFVDHGVRILERFFVNPDSRMNPHLKYSQVRKGHNNDLGAPTGIIEMKDMYFYLDAIRLFERAKGVSAKILGEFRNWLEIYLEWLLTSSQGKGERKAKNNHGTCYDLQVASIASYLGNKEIVFDAFARSQSRIGQQFAPDGAQPHELNRKTTAHYCCFNFQTWINIAELAARWGVDLWAYETAKGAGLKSGARWLAAHMDQSWPYEQIDDFDAERFDAIWFAAEEHVEGLPGKKHVPVSSYFAKPVYFPHNGIRPFWNLASYGTVEMLKSEFFVKNGKGETSRNRHI